jgi:hypothetical protein
MLQMLPVEKITLPLCSYKTINRRFNRKQQNPVSIKKNEIQAIVTQPEKVKREDNVHQEQRGGGKPVRLLAVLCLLSLAVLAWFVFSGDRSDKNKKETYQECLAPS